MKRKRYGFTVLEILTVIVVIAILVGVLIPALTMVQRIAKETQQRAQLATIEFALEAFKGDYGAYPPSDWSDLGGLRYCGAQMLSEALLGWDLMGFHPDSVWDADGGGDSIYPDPLNQNNPSHIENLKERRGPYLELATTKVFQLGRSPGNLDGLFSNTAPLDYDTYVLCDVFGIKKVRLTDGSTVRAGTPILYYRANTSEKVMDKTDWFGSIYNVFDNQVLIEMVIDEKNIPANEENLTLANTSRQFQSFLEFVTDPKATTPTMVWPYHPDSYILITAGADGLYGTDDDICNF